MKGRGVRRSSAIIGTSAPTDLRERQLIVLHERVPRRGRDWVPSSAWVEVSTSLAGYESGLIYAELGRQEACVQGLRDRDDRKSESKVHRER